MALLDEVKVACRVTSQAYDDELSALINSAFADIGIANVRGELLEEGAAPPLVTQAVKTYCRINFPYEGMDASVMERLKVAYDEQKAQLLMSSTYTEWGDGDA